MFIKVTSEASLDIIRASRKLHNKSVKVISKDNNRLSLHRIVCITLYKRHHTFFHHITWLRMNGSTHEVTPPRGAVTVSLKDLESGVNICAASPALGSCASSAHESQGRSTSKLWKRLLDLPLWESSSSKMFLHVSQRSDRSC